MEKPIDPLVDNLMREFERQFSDQSEVIDLLESKINVVEELAKSDNEVAAALANHYLAIHELRKSKEEFNKSVGVFSI